MAHILSLVKCDGCCSESDPCEEIMNAIEECPDCDTASAGACTLVTSFQFCDNEFWGYHDFEKDKYVMCTDRPIPKDFVIQYCQRKLKYLRK